MDVQTKETVVGQSKIQPIRTTFKDRAAIGLKYGIPVTPLHGKRPYLDDWQNQGFTAHVQVDAHDRRHPNDNAGLVSKAEPGGFCVLEVDSPDVARRYRQDTGLDLPKDTLMVASRPELGRGHRWFRHTPASIELGNVSQDDVPEGDFSFRAHNQQAVAPHSIHPDTGRPYKLMRDMAPIPIPDELVAWLAAQSKRRQKPTEANTAETTAPKQKIPHGSVYGALMKQAGKLWHEGYPSEKIADMLLAWAHANCEPPIDDAKIRQYARGNNWANGDVVRVTAEPQVREDEVTKPQELQRPDMPESVLCGRLGEWCRERLGDFCVAYSWPAILTAASALVKKDDKVRTNLYSCLVGPIHTGKSQVGDRAAYLFQLKELNALIDGKFGSGEGLIEQIGDRFGMPVLWYPDELSHLLEKAQIQNASFPFVLNTLFYKDQNDLTVLHRKKVSCHARLSILGGVVEENFEHSFGAASAQGLYDRFLFGLCPSGFVYSYRPLEGAPLVRLPFDWDKVITTTINPDVWESRDAVQKAEGIDHRVLEIAIRTAVVCAAWDGRTSLDAADLEPAWDLARYQQRVRAVLQPNPGKNFEAIAAQKILNYVKARPGKWLNWRDVYRGTHVIRDYGPSIAERARNGLFFAGEIEQSKTAPKSGPKRLVIRFAAEPENLAPVSSNNGCAHESEDGDTRCQVAG